MKTRVFTFTPDKTGVTDFRIAYETLRARDPQKCTGTERQWVEQLQRALEGVSEPVGDLAEDAEIDLRWRRLVKAGATITITQKAHEKMEAYLEEAPFQAGYSIPMADFRDRWGQAEKNESEEVPGKSPRKLKVVESASE